ncbi:sugar transferase [Alkalihalobacterium sp. APHAB7]|uniref:sugar transferase n=1 Tax=Alkalihalobacterium sp. APHAB7 TaxID=3402081 RepID=UPI003AAC61AF
MEQIDYEAKRNAEKEVAATTDLSVKRIKSRSNMLLYPFSKRSLDIAGSLMAIVIFSPLFFLISIFYLFEKRKGSIFFKQLRVGKNGEMFQIYKFRSMAIDAEERLKSDRILYEKYIENNYKLEPEEDPRITKLGAFLRKTSLDELPQFINVLKGDMSLVGPRPVVEAELNEYGNKADLFLSVKPGVTGYWQVSGRSNIGYPQRVNLELEYVYKQSLLFDIKIIFKTFLIVFLKRGAY